MARAAARHDPDLARDGGVGAHHDATVVAGRLQLVGVGEQASDLVAFDPEEFAQALLA